MGKLTFKGGIHPYEGKELSKNSPIEKYLPKGEMVYPLSQHIGAPSVPCVNKGDRVLAGPVSYTHLMSLISWKARWHSTRNRMRTYFPTHCSRRLLLSSSSTVRHRRQRWTRQQRTPKTELIRYKVFIKEKSGGCAGKTVQPVSYTHLDVYKRQVPCIYKICAYRFAVHGSICR